MSIQHSIDDSVDLENRSPESTKLFTKISLLASDIALIMFFICVVSYQIDKALRLNVFAATCLPMLILFVVALYLSVAERLRAKYLGARIAVVMACLVFIGVFVFMMVEVASFGTVYVAPFNPPPLIKNIT